MKNKLMLAAFIALFTAGGTKAQEADSTAYKKTKLKIEEVNFISSYYTQDGNNSAVTGGVGTEKLTDFATTIDVKLSRKDKKIESSCMALNWEWIHILLLHQIKLILIRLPLLLIKMLGCIHH